MQPRKCLTATVKGPLSPRLMRLNPTITFGATQTDAGVARQFSPGPGRVVRELLYNLHAQNINLDRRCDPALVGQKKSETKKIRLCAARRYGAIEPKPAPQCERSHSGQPLNGGITTP